MKHTLIAVLMLMSWLSPAHQSHGSGIKRILYVDSYHGTLEWSAGIARGIRSVLSGRTDIDLMMHHMDTKRNTSEAFMTQAGRETAALISTWKPDLVITSDDNAAKYLIVPYLKNAALPVVFCGVNWSAEEYGFPAENMTGMIEVQHIDQILSTLKPYARGPRIGFIKGDDSSARKEADFYEQHLRIAIDRYFVTTYDQWKSHFQMAQARCDILLIGNAASISGWDPEDARNFVQTATRIPSGNWDEWMKEYAVVTFATQPEEQGEWAAGTALRILAGEKPMDIPVVTNKKAKIILNMGLAKHLGIRFPMEIIDDAHFVDEL